jgi:tetratricopeptide (TPR) repeat protein
VRQLIAEARADYERKPERALAVLDVAATVTNGLRDMFALAAQRATVGRERANALRVLGRHREALEELEWAERFLRHLPAHAGDLALVDWTRSAVLLHLSRYDEALDAARRAMAVLDETGDAARLQQMRVIEAGILYEQGHVDLAIETYEQLAGFFAGSGDRLTRARIEANLAECRMRLGAWSEMRQHATTALVIFAGLGNETEQVRVRWTLAHALLRQGRIAEALASLYELEAAFTLLGMRGEAAGVLLDIVEAYLLRGAWDDAVATATRAASVFTMMEAPVHVAHACSYLRDAVASRNANVALVRYVRDYVSRGDAGTKFEPPSESALSN